MNVKPWFDFGSVNWTNLALLGFTLTGLWWGSSSLRSSRPPETLLEKEPAGGKEDVLARQWQDPFEAVFQQERRFESQRRGAPACTGPSCAGCACDPAWFAGYFLRRDPQVEPMVLGVMVTGDPYANGVEWRVRSRVALLSALGMAGYVPEDDGHISYVEFSDWPSKTANPDLGGARKCGNLIVPFESFRFDGQKGKRGAVAALASACWNSEEPQLMRALHISCTYLARKEPPNSRPKRIVVLWLAENAFENSPWNRIQRLCQVLGLYDSDELPPATAPSAPTPAAPRTGERAPVSAPGAPREPGHDIPQKSIPHDRRSRLNYRFCLLGPWGSGVLSDMYQGMETASQPPSAFGVLLRDLTEVVTGKRLFASLGIWKLFFWGDRSKEQPQASAIEELCGMELYCSSATISDALLDDRCRFDCTGCRPRDSVRKRFEKHNIHFNNVTCTDSQLIAELIYELKIRGVDVVGGPDRVLLISEQDTLYGRALPKTFREILREEGACQEKVQQFTYLRGLDGKLATEQAAGSAAGGHNTKAEGRDKKPDLEEFERPEGKSQLDYVTRVARFLDRDQESKNKIRAVGILGSDVYDKLLLLQSLRAQYPKALFFTTDLDARLLHPQEQGWTRGLIVTSSFGFQLAESYQRRIPPFRDSYQTGLFLATLMAVRDRELDKKAIKAYVPHARCFEVGRYTALDLSRTPESAKPDSTPPREVAADRARPNVTQGEPGKPDFHPPREESHAARNLGYALLFVALIGLAMIPTMGATISNAVSAVFPRFAEKLRIPKPIHGPGNSLSDRRLWICVLVVLLVWAICAVFVVWDQYREGGEPFSVFEGISIWPSVLLRLFAAGLGATLLVEANSSLRRTHDKLEEDFKLAPLTEECSSGFHAWCRLCWDSLRLVLTGWEFRCLQQGISKPRLRRNRLEVNEVDVNQLWQNYRRQSKGWNPLLRCFWVGTFFLAAAVGLFWLLGWPSQPHRGRISELMSLLSLALAVLVLVFLMAYVLDLTRLCERFTSALAASPTKWPSGLLKEWKQERGITPQCLDEWLDMRFIGKLTKQVGRLIWYPFIVLFLLIVARNGCFHHFDWPISLYLVFGISAAYSWFTAFSLRHAAEEARKAELERLHNKLTVAQRRGDKLTTAQRRGDHKPNVEKRDAPVLQIDELITEIRDNVEGAFAPLPAHPVVGVLLMVLAALSASPFIERLGAWLQ
jgi:hypothetical protein